MGSLIPSPPVCIDMEEEGQQNLGATQWLSLQLHLQRVFSTMQLC